MPPVVPNTTLDPDVERLITSKLTGLDDFEKLRMFAELIELFSREVPALLAEMRIEHLRRLTEVYSQDEIMRHAGLSANRIRKLMNR